METAALKLDILSNFENSNAYSHQSSSVQLSVRPSVYNVEVSWSPSYRLGFLGNNFTAD